MDGRKNKRFKLAEGLELVAQPPLDADGLVPFYQIRRDNKIIATLRFLRKKGAAVICSLDFYNGGRETNFASTFKEAVVFLKEYNWNKHLRGDR